MPKEIGARLVFRVLIPAKCPNWNQVLSSKRKEVMVLKAKMSEVAKKAMGEALERQVFEGPAEQFIRTKHGIELSSPPIVDEIQTLTTSAPSGSLTDSKSSE